MEWYACRRAAGVRSRSGAAAPGPALRGLPTLRFLATDFSPLRSSRDYRYLWTGGLISSLGRQVTTVALPYQVYTLTHSSLAVGEIGLAQLLPVIVMSLVGGSLADRVDRRVLLLVLNVLLGFCSTILMIGGFLHWHSVVVLYVLAAIIAGLAAADIPTRTAVIPKLVSADQLSSALSMMSVAQQITLILGPALAGVLLASFGFAQAYMVDVITFAVAIVTIVLISAQPPLDQRREPPIRAIVGGITFTWNNAIIRGTLALDVVAVVFGLRRALYPFLAMSVYHVGATGLGLLYAAPAVGALLAAATSGWIGRTRPQGVIVIVAAAIYGLSALGLGLSTSFLAALVAVAIGGAADTYSVVARTTIVQTITPDGMRGRVSSMQFMSATVGNYLGDFEAGLAANAISPTFSMLTGGGLVLALGTVLVAATPSLYRYRAARR